MKLLYIWKFSDRLVNVLLKSLGTKLQHQGWIRQSKHSTLYIFYEIFILNVLYIFLHPGLTFFFLGLYWRLTFWLSNTVVLREIISQTFGNLLQSNPVLKAVESNGNAKKFDGKSTPSRWKNSSGSKQAKKFTAMQLADDWQETGTFTVALEKIESWIFSRIVESVWWQVKLYSCTYFPCDIIACWLLGNISTLTWPLIWFCQHFNLLDV